MTVVAAFALLLVNLHLGHSCDGEGHILICQNIPQYFSPGYLTLVMYLHDFGEISSTVFRSSNLASVTRLKIENAGVTGIAAGAFSSFQNLRNLSLNDNMVTQINSNWFERPSIIRELNLTGNQIEAVNESMLSGLADLTVLRLNMNKIKTIGPNSFSSQTNLTELDLSDNKLTRVSPQVFRSLRSARIKLHGNPWDCTCEAEDSVDYLRDLWSRSLLDTQVEVTCESPPPLKHQPVWNVSVCATPPTLRPPSGTQTVHPKLTDAVNTVPASSATTSPARPTSETKTSVQPKPTEIIVTTIPLKTATYVTSSPLPAPSQTKTSVHPKPSDVLITASPHTEVTEPPSNPVCTLIVVIAVLCVLLFVLCSLAVLHRRKRNNKTVIPGRPEEEKNKFEDGSESGHNQLPGHLEQSDPEMAWRRLFTGTRAKSANAVLLMSSFCVSGKDQVLLQKETEAQSKDPETQTEGKQKLVSEAEAGEVIEAESLSNTDTIEKNEKQADADRDLGENPHCVSVNTETVPYLSIGTNPDDPNKQSTNSPGQRPLMRKVMGRISTWPPTAIQWQARCKMKEEEEDASDDFTVWTQSEMFKFSSEIKKIVEHPSGSDVAQKEDETEENQEDLQTVHMKMRLSKSSKPNDKSTSFSEAHTHNDAMPEKQLKEGEIMKDRATGRQTGSNIQNQNEEEPENLSCKPAENPAHKPTRKSSNKAEQRRDPKGAATSRQKAPSGGTTPDDETLLSGNEYAFMDLLHEVVQNNGRWTRERWKQVHVNKQRR